METPKIYLVEDDVFYTRTLQYAFWHSEFNNVKSFSNPEDFFREMNFQEPDMVIIGNKTGDATGIELLKKIKIRNKRTSVVLISADTRKEIVAESIKAGAMAFIQKDNLTISKLKVLARKILIRKKYASPGAIAA